MSEPKPSDVIEFSTDGMAAPRRDNSLLAKMGFADADRKDPLHDLACRYLAQPEMASRLVERAARNLEDVACFHKTAEVHPEFHITKGSGPYQTTIGFADLVLSFLCVTKDDIKERRSDWFWSEVGDRAKKIGIRERFDGGFYGYPEYYPDYPRVEEIKKEVRPLSNAVFSNPEAITMGSDGEWVDSETGWRIRSSAKRWLLIEVKTGATAASDILRQMEVYRTYLSKNPSLFLVTNYDLSQPDVDMLKSRGVTHLRLGAAFQEWCRHQQQAPKAQSPEI